MALPAKKIPPQDLPVETAAASNQETQKLQRADSPKLDNIVNLEEYRKRKEENEKKRQLDRLRQTDAGKNPEQELAEKYRQGSPMAGVGEKTPKPVPSPQEAAGTAGQAPSKEEKTDQPKTQDQGQPDQNQLEPKAQEAAGREKDTQTQATEQTNRPEEEKKEAGEEEDNKEEAGKKQKKLDTTGKVLFFFLLCAALFLDLLSLVTADISFLIDWALAGGFLVAVTMVLYLTSWDLIGSLIGTRSLINLVQTIIESIPILNLLPTHSVAVIIIYLDIQHNILSRAAKLNKILKK